MLLVPTVMEVSDYLQVLCVYCQQDKLCPSTHLANALSVSSSHEITVTLPMVVNRTLLVTK